VYGTSNHFLYLFVSVSVFGVGFMSVMAIKIQLINFPI
jgi:hypothetical protein